MKEWRNPIRLDDKKRTSEVLKLKYQMTISQLFERPKGKTFQAKKPQKQKQFMRGPQASMNLTCSEEENWYGRMM